MAEKKYRLDLTRTLNALDSKQFDFYDNLDDEEKKGYAPLILMRYMSILQNGHPSRNDSVILVNDLVNVCLWSFSKYPDFLHLLLCMTGVGKPQGQWERKWISKKSTSKTKKVDEFLIGLHPGINKQELSIIKSQYDNKSFKQLLKDSGLDDQAIKIIYDDFKNRTTGE
jgi:hypothetical protein